jgi:hypothetical protein
VVEVQFRGIRVLCAGLALLIGAAAAARADEPPPAPPLPSSERGAVLDAVDPPADTAPVRLERRGNPLTWSVAVEGGIAITDDPEGILGLPLGGRGRPFDWGENSYGSAFAARVTVTRHIRQCQRLELRGMWTADWKDTTPQEGRNFGFSQNTGGGLILSPQVASTLTNQSNLWSVELNWWRTTPRRGGSRLDYAVGLRVIQFEDKARATDWVGLAPDAYLEGEATNTLWAAQGAVAWRLGAWKRFELSVGGKGMVGLRNRDLTERDTSIVTGGPTTDARRERTDFGWALEGEITAIFRPVARIGITASYTILFMGDVTHANKMLDLSRAATGSVQIVDSKDDLLVHSLFFGVRIDL